MGELSPVRQRNAVAGGRRCIPRRDLSSQQLFRTNCNRFKLSRRGLSPAALVRAIALVGAESGQRALLVCPGAVFLSVSRKICAALGRQWKPKLGVVPPECGIDRQRLSYSRFGSG